MLKRLLKKLLPPPLKILYKRYKRRLQKTKKMSLLEFGVDLVDHCNLGCKHCDHFSPIASEYFSDISVLEKDFQRLSELTNGKIGECKFLGGEPLLHPDIIGAITVFRKYFPSSAAQNNFPFNQAFVITNGLLLLKMPEEFWKCCRENQITIKMTKYPINLNFDAIEKKCLNEQVPFTYYGRTKSALKTLHFLPLDLTGKQNHKSNFYMCRNSNSACTALKDGKFYPCHIIPNIHHFNKYFSTNLEIEERDYIDIYETSDVENILSFLTKPKPFCRYCMTSGKKTKVPWGLSKREISEWA